MASTPTSALTALLLISCAVGSAAIALQPHQDAFKVVAPPEAPEDGLAGQVCPGTGSCFVVHSTPGCSNGFCCAVICNIDPFCCEVQWDNFCVGSANQYCTGCGGAGTGLCTVPHLTPWCQNKACCNTVCAVDPFCCSTQWDSICVSTANQRCGCGAVLAGDCFTAHPAPWCNKANCCDIVCIGYDPFCCEESWDQLCAELAQDVCVCGGGGTKSCFKVHSTPWCSRGACCNQVCATDPFCCEVQWDAFCVGGAFQFCCPADVSPCNGGNGVVNIDDLLSVINSWGPAPPNFFECIRDVSPNGGNGVVNVDDLLFIINRWGPCS